MAEVADYVAADEGSPDDGAVPVAVGEHEKETSASELLEQAGRDASILVVREVQLASSRHVPELGRAARNLAVALAVVIAFITAFALGNWAAVSALSSPLPGWRAPLVVAAAWLAVGAALLLFVLARSGQLQAWRWWRALVSDPAEIVRDRERARDEAQNAVRESLERLAEAAAREAGAIVAVAVVPLAGGVIEAGEDAIGVVEEVTEVIEEKVPGGGAIDRLVSIALTPGRYAFTVANRTLGRDESGNGPAQE